MLDKVAVRNFKRFDEVEIELGKTVVFIGPNNSGKTTALQALALWEVGLRRWNEKRKGKATPEKRPGVTINRRDLVAIPVPDADLLWRDLHVRDVQRIDGRQRTQNVRIDIIVEGVTDGTVWQCGLEFDYANEESFYCRPLRLSDTKNPERMPVPEEAGKVRIAFLPPMSGLASNETRLDSGAINVRIGEGRTAEVLRNLCYKIYQNSRGNWDRLVTHIGSLFGAELGVPQYIAERGEITMGYREKGIQFDLSSSGKGLQQTLLLLAYMYDNPGAVLLLDEPDAHLEILRQREVYKLIVDVTGENGSQVVAASHSEVLLEEAKSRDVVIAFVGKPHRTDDRSSQVLKALRDIRLDQYHLAEQTGWVLYLEGSTDLSILQALAERLHHEEARRVLERPFVHYVGNEPGNVRTHFYGLREAARDLKAIAIFDRLDRELPPDLGAEGLVWRRREIENYLCYPETLKAFAEASAAQESLGPLFMLRRVRAMEEAIQEVQTALETLRRGSPWENDTKVSDDFLTPLFEAFYKKLGLDNAMRKSNFHELARFVPIDKIDPEISEKLDAIVRVAKSARPSL